LLVELAFVYKNNQQTAAGPPVGTGQDRREATPLRCQEQVVPFPEMTTASFQRTENHLLLRARDILTPERGQVLAVKVRDVVWVAFVRPG
jgi:hypothetical protein